MGTAVITCCDTPPVLQFAERIFNEMPTFIQRFVERKGCISGFPRRYADRHPPRFQRLPQPGRIIPPSARKMPSSGRRCWRMAAPLQSLTCPSVSKSRTGRPCPSQTAWSLEFNPPFVRPMRRAEPPFCADLPPGGGP